MSSQNRYFCKEMGLSFLQRIGCRLKVVCKYDTFIFRDNFIERYDYGQKVESQAGTLSVHF